MSADSAGAIVALARRRRRRDLGHHMVDGCYLEAVDVREALEYGAHGIAGALGDLDGRWHVRGVFLCKRQIGLDDALPCLQTAQSPTIHPWWGLGSRPFGQGHLNPA